jgi:hypothetical protein
MGNPYFELDRLEEDRRIEQLRQLVDDATEQLLRPEIGWEEGRKLIENVRKRAIELFPRKEGVFDLICKPRFYRILDEKFHML